MILIACSQTKLASPAAARDLYTGQAFRLARRLAERTGQEYLILSALHGLVDPTQVLEPYSLYLGAQSKDYRAQWFHRVNSALVSRDITRATAYAGSAYVSGLNIELELPLRGLGIGSQLGYLSAALKSSPFFEL